MIDTALIWQAAKRYMVGAESSLRQAATLKSGDHLRPESSALAMANAHSARDDAIRALAVIDLLPDGEDLRPHAQNLLGAASFVGDGDGRKMQAVDFYREPCRLAASR